MEHLLIGVDEAGTGAWAGPATVAAFAVYARNEGALKATGVRDSKKMNDRARRDLFVEIMAYAEQANVSMIPAKALGDDHRGAWREGVATAVRPIVEAHAKKCKITLVVDGKEDVTLAGYFDRVWGLRVRFEPRADDLYPAVSAASVLAKTIRNDEMIALAKTYPAWGFEQHYGYGVAAHAESICVYGVCPEHRKIRPLIHYFQEVT